MTAYIKGTANARKDRIHSYTNENVKHKKCFKKAFYYMVKTIFFCIVSYFFVVFFVKKLKKKIFIYFFNFSFIIIF